MIVESECLVPTPVNGTCLVPPLVVKLVYNDEQQYTDTCPEGFSGEPITITIPAGTFSDSVGEGETEEEVKDALNALALAEAQAQAEALRENTPCVPDEPEVESGSLWGWGYSAFRVLGMGDTLNRYTPDLVGETAEVAWTQVSTGGTSSIGLKSDGTLWTWGGNYNGELGQGTVSSWPSTAHDEFFPKQVGEDKDWSQVSIGESNVYGLKTNGTLWSWGWNWGGQLALGDFDDRHEPVQIGEATDWAFVSAGKSFVLGLKTDGTLWAAGYNDPYGYFGLGDVYGDDYVEYYENFVQVPGLYSKIAAGDNHVIAIKPDGTLWTWGYLVGVPAADPEVSDSNVSPVQVGSDDDWVYVSAHGNGSAAIKADGTVWVAGEWLVDYGVDQPADHFVQVGTGTDWEKVVCGRTHVLALRSDGTIWGMGRGLYGQLGQAYGDDSLVDDFVQIGPDDKWVGIGAGNFSSFGMRRDTSTPPPPVGSSGIAEGGSVSIVGGYYIHRFDHSANFNVINGSGVIFERLLVGGGGSGGGLGGGGGGEVIEESSTLADGSYPVVVGGRGIETLPQFFDGSAQGKDGMATTFNGTTALGGGGGGARGTLLNGRDGGCGGGGGTALASGSGTGGAPAGEGGSGGNGSRVEPFGMAGGGGGGYGGNGTAGSSTEDTSVGGAGGPGVSSSITGEAVIYGAGGGGGAALGTPTAGAGGSSGAGGNGATAFVPAEAGKTPGSGGGGGSGSAPLDAGPGARGVFIVRYPVPS